MNPQQPDPVLQQRAMQQALQQAQPQQQTDQATPDILQQAQDQAAQGAQKINAKTQQQKNDFENADTISKAMAVLNPNANMKDGEANTMSKVGQAMGDGSRNWANLCEAFAENQIYGHTGIYPNAFAAYQDQASKGNINTSTNNIPAKAQVFMAPDSSNGGNGHTGVMQSNGKFLAPLSNGSIEQFTIPEWEKFSGQRFIGWAPPPKK